MARFECELFGLVQYSQELSYDELYEVENDLIKKIQEVLERNKAEHLDFWGAGDCLQFQCAFSEYDPKTLHTVFDETAGVLTDALKGRLFCFDKHLEDVCVVRISSGKWQETSKKIPCLLDGSEQTHQSTCAQSRITD